MSATTSAAEAAISSAYRAYGPRALELLARIRAACSQRGLRTGEPTDALSSDAYAWTLDVWRSPQLKLEVWITLDEAATLGAQRKPFAITFGLEVHAGQDQPIYDRHPANNTPQVWVDARDSAAVSQRWAELEALDLAELVDVIAGNAAADTPSEPKPTRATT